MSCRWLAVILLCLAARPAWGGAFAQRQGMLLVIQEFASTTAMEAYGASGSLAPRPLYRKTTADAALEYGALDWLTFLGRLEAARVYTQGPPAAWYRGPGMSELGARAEMGRALHGDLVFSAQALLSLPGARTANPAAAGLNRRETDLRLMMGGSFEVRDAPGFWSIEAGPRRRSGPEPGEWRAEAAAGYFLLDRLQVVGQTTSVFTPKTPLFPQSRSHKAQVSLVLNPGRPWSLQFGTFRTLSGVNARRETGLLLAWWRRM
jgi:hypothetical protein